MSPRFLASLLAGVGIFGLACPAGAFKNNVPSVGVLPVAPRADASTTVASPDGNVVVTVTVSSGSLGYAVDYRGVRVVEPSPLGPIVNGANLGTGVSFIGAAAYATNETFLSRQGIHAVATNQYQAQSISLSHAASGRSYVLNVRAYNNGVAFRYEFADTAIKNLTAEASGFVIPAGSMVWAQSGISDYQGIYYGTNIVALATNAVMGPPVVIQLSGASGFLALTESALGGVGDPYLQKVVGSTGRQLQVVYPINQDGSSGASFSGPGSTPWNVLMIGADLNMVVNNDIVESLAPAPDPTLFPQGTLTAWATTGRSVWDYLRPQPGGITPNGAMTNSYWAAQLGFEYNTIDEGWANWTNASGAVAPWPVVQQVVSFSHALGVKVLLWKTSSELSTPARRAAFFAQLQSCGVDGFKADFFDFNSVSASARERVKLQEDILREAATYQLVANFHGSTKPTGQFRTYPNLLEVEAVFGKEQWPQAAMVISVPFTRFLAGPADFTPLEFGGNGAFEIANVINMPGPIITFAERSDIIASSPYASLIRTIPSRWDETIVLSQSQLGQTTASARRKGQDWYIGIMNTAVPRNWTIPLTFLDPNTNYQAYMVRETSSTLESATVTRNSVLSVSSAQTGGSGFVAKLCHPPVFGLSSDYRLSGTVIGTSGSWSGSGNTKEKVFDGSLLTFFDAPSASGAWVGLDLGSGNQKVVGTLRYCPRVGWSPRMVGGVFQGANVADFGDAVTLYTVGYAPPEGAFSTVSLTNNTAFRYLRYLSAPNGWCNVAEMQLYTTPETPPQPVLTPAWDGTNLILTWAGGGQLLEATNISGPWTTNLSVNSPFFITPAQPQRFYRLQAQ